MCVDVDLSDSKLMKTNEFVCIMLLV